MICKYCGRESADNNGFCQFCGAELAPADPGAGLGTAALILGIVGLSLGTICSCFFAILGGIIPLACAIVAIVLGIKAKKKSAAVGIENKKAKIGLILGIIAIIVIVVFIALNGILGAIIGSRLTASYDPYY